MRTGHSIDLDEALRFGLVTAVVPQKTLMHEVYAMARTIANHSPLAVRATKKAVKQALASDLPNHLDYISSQMGLPCETEHFRKAVRKFTAQGHVRDEESP
jgi:enoyl-CoA hydratase/carnithine racemase